MKMPHIRSTIAAMIAVAGVVVAHASNFTITSSTSGSTTKFIVERSDTNTAETVNYRTVGLSAYAGGGATVRVAATAGGDDVDMSQINGVFAVEAGDDLSSLMPTAVPAANVTYENGEATIFVPSSAGTFIRAQIGVTAPSPAP